MNQPGAHLVDVDGMPRRSHYHLVFAVLAGLLGMVAPTSTAAAAATAVVVLSPANGLAGSNTTLAASGFPRRTAARVTVGTSSFTSQTDRLGRVTQSIRIPQTATGDVAVTVTTSTSTATARFHVSPAEPKFGVSTPGGPAAASELDEVTSLAGEAPSIVMFYRGFGADLDVRDLDAVAARGATPLLTWEPYDWSQGVDQPEFALKRIESGQFDDYARRYAGALKSWGRPVMLRFAHEMNGNWYPWSEAVNGNATGDYVAAWRHLHDIFAAEGVKNVSWVWSPNVVYPGSLPLRGLYPGDAYVDIVGIDGYNWGTATTWHTWTPPAELFEPTLAEVKLLAPTKRLLIAETASTESGGDKGIWIQELFTWLHTRPEIEAVVWFDHLKETDWRIGSSTTSARSFKEALATRRLA